MDIAAGSKQQAESDYARLQVEKNTDPWREFAAQNTLEFTLRIYSN